MARAKPTFVPTPRILTDYQVAARLGRSESWLRDHRDKLIGFPKRDDELGGTDGDAIEAWLDVRAGLIDTALRPIDREEWDEWQP